MITFIVRLFILITGWPFYFLLIRPRYYHSSPYKKTRGIKGPAIITCNHTHIFDFFAIFFTHPFRTQHVLVSEAIIEHPFLGFLCKLVGCVYVHRERSDLSFFAEAEKILKKGGIVTIFPEGHLVRDGNLDVFKPSAIYLAIRSGAPLVPHYIEPHYFSIKRTRIIVGEPYFVNKELQEREDIRKECDNLRSSTLALKRKMHLYQKYHTRDVFYGRSWFLDIVKVLLFLPTKIIYPTRFHYVNGASRIDRKIIGRGIVISKHRGFNDAPILAMHYLTRRVHIIVGKDIHDSMGWVLDHLLSIEYDRKGEKSDPSTFLNIINILKAEGVIGIYPEGHIKANEDGKFYDGAAYFSLMSNSPIYLYYTMKPYKIFRFNHVMIGKVIYPDKLYSKEEIKNKETISLFTSYLQEQFLTLKNAGQKYQKKAKN